MARSLQSSRTVDRSSNGRELAKDPGATRGVDARKGGHWGVSIGPMGTIVLGESQEDPRKGGHCCPSRTQPRGPFKRSKWNGPPGIQSSHDTCCVGSCDDEEVDPNESEASIRIVRHTRRGNADGVHRFRRWQITCRHDRTYPNSDTFERCDSAESANRDQADEDRIRTRLAISSFGSAHVVRRFFRTLEPPRHRRSHRLRHPHSSRFDVRWTRHVHPEPPIPSTCEVRVLSYVEQTWYVFPPPCDDRSSSRTVDGGFPALDGCGGKVFRGKASPPLICLGSFPRANSELWLALFISTGKQGCESVVNRGGSDPPRYGRISTGFRRARARVRRARDAPVWDRSAPPRLRNTRTSSPAPSRLVSPASTGGATSVRPCRSTNRVGYMSPLSKPGRSQQRRFGPHTDRVGATNHRSPGSRMGPK